MVNGSRYSRKGDPCQICRFDPLHDEIDVLGIQGYSLERCQAETHFSVQRLPLERASPSLKVVGDGVGDVGHEEVEARCRKGRGHGLRASGGNAEDPLCVEQIPGFHE